MSKTTEQAAERLTLIGKELAPAVAQEENKDLKHILSYFISLIPAQVAILMNLEDDDVMALALSVLGKDAK